VSTAVLIHLQQQHPSSSREQEQQSAAVVDIDRCSDDGCR